tara:strand:+ start:672 stop:842 length:171 start_codon:yes stop_codon:yes gene_type:complete
LVHVKELFTKSWVFILIGVIVPVSLSEEVGGSVIEDFRTLGKELGHFDDVVICAKM